MIRWLRLVAMLSCCMLSSCLLAGCATPPSADAPSATVEDGEILVFTRTEGFRHDSIPVAVETLRELAASARLRVAHGEDPAVFSDAGLQRYQAIVFVSTTGDVLDPSQQAALERYVARGGGWLGVHAAADTEYDWPWYGELVGAWFAGHPPGLQRSRVGFEGPHAGLADGWAVTDELYNYRRNPRGDVAVLATVFEADYAGGTMGDDHPIAWCHGNHRGRAWYTGLGHDAGVYDDPVFRAHLARGLRWVAGLAEDC